MTYFKRHLVLFGMSIVGVIFASLIAVWWIMQASTAAFVAVGGIVSICGAGAATYILHLSMRDQKKVDRV
jgi:uncharacterized ion transporter superfamily protein YfcC